MGKLLQSFRGMEQPGSSRGSHATRESQSTLKVASNYLGGCWPKNKADLTLKFLRNPIKALSAFNHALGAFSFQVAPGLVREPAAASFSAQSWFNAIQKSPESYLLQSWMDLTYFQKFGENREALS